MFSTTIDHKVFFQALTAIGASIASRSTLPVLGNVKLEGKEDGLYLSTTNLESYSCYRIPEASVTEGAITVSYKELFSLVKPLKGQVLRLSQESNTLHIEANGFSVSLSGIDASEFPHVPTVAKEEVRIPLQSVTLPVETLRKLVNLVAYAASIDDSRPVFTAICVSLKNDVLELAAADAFRMSIARETVPGSGSWDFSLLIPAKILQSLVKLGENKRFPKTGMVSIVAVCSGHTTISMDDMSMSAYIRLVEGSFPNYNMIVPQKSELTAVIDVPQFKTALQSVQGIVKDNANITRLHLNGALEVQARRDGMDKPMSVHVPSENKGKAKELDALLNWKYLSDVLAVNPGKTVQLDVQAPDKPKERVPFGSYKPAPVKPGDELLTTKPIKVTFPDMAGFTAVLMPMNVKR